jgi:hypothetical protein
MSSGGTSNGLPVASTATIVRYALLVCCSTPVAMSSASTRTPTSIEVRHTAFTEARNVSSWPRRIGRRNVIRPMAAVTTI